MWSVEWGSFDFFSLCAFFPFFKGRNRNRTGHSVALCVLCSMIFSILLLVFFF